MSWISISLENTSYTYRVTPENHEQALHNVNVEGISNGDIICIMGPNGAGKSTFIELISGNISGGFGNCEIVLRYEDRTARYNNIEETPLSSIYIPQSPSDGIIPTLNVESNIKFRNIARQRLTLSPHIKDNSDIQSFLDKYDFGWLLDRSEESIENLSGGEKQLVNTLSAIYSEPDLLLLDEPASKLDEVHRVDIWNLILKSSEKDNITSICVTHDLEMANRVSDLIVHLDEGKVVGTTKPSIGRDIQFPGETRIIESAEAAEQWANPSNEWWYPTEDSLFKDGYYLGDDSLTGYLSDQSLTRPERTKREVTGVVNLLDISPDDKILDVPCGWGRHSMELAKRGYNVTGVDLNQEYVDRALEESKDMDNVSFHVADMRKLASILQAESFDFVINMWTSFGFFRDTEDDIRVLSQWSHILKNEGKALIHLDLNPKRVKKGIFDEPPVRPLGNGNRLKVVEKFCPENDRVYGKWEIKGNDKIGPFGYTIRVYTINEWERVSSESGFKVQSVYGSFDAEQYNFNDKSQEFIVVLEKC